MTEPKDGLLGGQMKHGIEGEKFYTKTGDIRLTQKEKNVYLSYGQKFDFWR